MNLRKQLKHGYRSFTELLKSGQLYRWLFFVSIVGFIATLVLPIWRLLPLVREKTFIPLHYNIYFGVDRFGPWYEAFLLPALAGFFLLVNVVMQAYFLKTEKMLAQFFAVSSIFIEMIFLIGMILLILLNI